jgi:hypothetical protein
LGLGGEAAEIRNLFSIHELLQERECNPIDAEYDQTFGHPLPGLF